MKEERLEDATKAAKENFKAKLMEVGSSLQALASQVDARSGDGEVGCGEGRRHEGRGGRGREMDGLHASLCLIF